jgi:hypothetical protein
MVRGLGKSGSRLTSLKVYDILGREVRTLVNDNLPPGSYEVTFSAEGACLPDRQGSASGGDAAGLASGVYLYRLSVSPLARRGLVPTSRDGQAGTFSTTKKMILAR